MNITKTIATIRSFNRFYTNIIGVIDSHILDSPYSLTEVRILWEIHNHHEQSARLIGSALHLDEGYLSRTISKLIKQGLIIKRQSDDDARVYKLALSKKGEKTFLELDKKASDAIKSMTSSLSSTEVTEMVRCMEKIKDILQKT